MAARRLAASAVDWAAFVERVHPHQMESFRAFKAKSDAFVAKYVSYPMSPGSSDRYKLQTCLLYTSPSPRD